jgi:small subunit ribosomal protein S27Ae
MAARPDKKDGGAKKDAGKKEKGKHTQKKWKAYTVTAEGVKRNRKSCPKCGEGVHLAQHKDRQSCGKCGYTEFAKK